MATEEAKKRKIEPGTVKLQMAGDLMLARPTDPEAIPLFRKYEALLEKLANMPKEERLLNYKFFIALILTGHAKKIQDTPERKKIFDLKNQIFFDIANNLNTRRKVAFMYLTSKNFRVLNFCPRCEEKNKTSDQPRHLWKFCKDCSVDRKFYNVLSMHHKFDDGSATIFLSNDLINQIKNLRVNQKSHLEEHEEGAKLGKYIYNVKGLNIFNIDSVMTAHKKLLKLK